MEITGRYLSFEDAKAAAINMSIFWNEPYQVTRKNNLFVVTRGWPPQKQADVIYCALPEVTK
jgi:hypothetical protein